MLLFIFALSLRFLSSVFLPLLVCLCIVQLSWWLLVLSIDRCLDVCSWERAHSYTVHNFKSNTNLLGIECRWNDAETISSFSLFYINRFLNDVGIFFLLLWLLLSKWFIVDKTHVDGLHWCNFKTTIILYSIDFIYRKIKIYFLVPEVVSVQGFFLSCCCCSCHMFVCY